ncbi:hypothetical protein BKA82DRAFT_10633 [Pisolithus tinctorius]|uniref:Uncharacterized protein n=1 Tax=Pisolithus tinctorius Marx 270 TaxID=870435 RepID=A0A0C3NAD0_PISTI|nr:hypothetical protein BKA82DRAFT_10633 [Pisolithus tinctorius]KIN98064.1 hypothetical protein M404DRAFT_10633 [Pisolithus tinctorius Marx 270]
MEQEKHEEQVAKACAIKQVAEVINGGTEAERNLLTSCQQPRTHRAPLSQEQTRVTCSTLGQDVADGMEDVEEVFGDGPTQEESENNIEITEEAVTARKQHAQKIGTCDLVEAAQRTSPH